MDDRTAIAAAAAFGSAKLVEQVLGPTASYLGEGLREFTKQRVENVKRIIESADCTLGERVQEPGVVPPRVLKRILDEGSYRDDPLSVEYFGGVLASSRTSSGEDDRGAYLLSIVEQMSAYQLRSHYLLYQAIRSYNRNKHVGTQQQSMDSTSILVDAAELGAALSDDRKFASGSVVPHVIAGLTKEGLIGGLEGVQSEALRRYTSGCLVVIPTMLGFELYFWAHGLSRVLARDWLSSNVNPHPLVDLGRIKAHSFDASVLREFLGVMGR